MNRPDFVNVLQNLVKTQRAKGYKPAWVWHQISSRFTPFSETELKCIAAALGYKPGWVWHQLKNQPQAQQACQPLSKFQASLNLLELEISFTLEELKLSYRTKALQLHPDRGGSNERFVALNEAYKYLKDYLHLESVS